MGLEVNENNLLAAEGNVLAAEGDVLALDAQAPPAQEQQTEVAAGDRAEIDPVILEKLAELEKETTEVLVKQVQAAFERSRTVLRFSLQLPVSFALGKRKFDEMWAHDQHA